MTNMLFSIPLAPVAKGRPRQGRVKGSGAAIFFTPKRTRDFENALAQHVHLQMRAKGWVPYPKAMPLHAHVRLTFAAKDKKKQGTYKISRPDSDNLIKICFDSLNGIAYPDDAQIVFITALKGYGRTDRIDIELRALSIDGFTSAFSENP